MFHNLRCAFSWPLLGKELTSFAVVSNSAFGPEADIEPVERSYKIRSGLLSKQPGEPIQYVPRALAFCREAEGAHVVSLALDHRRRRNAKKQY
jgi:hypothetical protein